MYAKTKNSTYRDYELKQVCKPFLVSRRLFDTRTARLYDLSQRHDYWVQFYLVQFGEFQQPERLRTSTNTLRRTRCGPAKLSYMRASEQTSDMIRRVLIDWVLNRYEQTNQTKYKVALDTFRAQLGSQPRTPAGAFWHRSSVRIYGTYARYYRLIGFGFY